MFLVVNINYFKFNEGKKLLVIYSFLIYCIVNMRDNLVLYNLVRFGRN